MVTPRPAAWVEFLAVRPDLARAPLVAAWADALYPLVVRRPARGDEPEAVPLGLPLPPAEGKRRIALTLPPSAITRVSPPPLLRAAAGAAPASWRPAIDELLGLDPHVRVFGSLAWQHLTSLAYLAEGSDLDLLWTLPAAGGLDRLLAGIAAIQGRAPMRIDGEILGQAGGVNWRELQTEGDVLVKSRADLHLMPRAAFLASGCA